MLGRAMDDSDILAAVLPDAEEKEPTELERVKTAHKALERLINGVEGTDDKPAQRGYGDSARGERYAAALAVLASALAELQDEKDVAEFLAKRAANKAKDVRLITHRAA
jgi:hypothetical protein